MSRLALILTAVVACSSVCSVVAQGGPGGRLQGSTCPSGEIKVQRKVVSREFKEKYAQYNGRAYENKDACKTCLCQSRMGALQWASKLVGKKILHPAVICTMYATKLAALTQQKCTYTTPLIF